MSVSVALVIGAVISALDGIGIFFAQDEPFKIEIFVAAIFKGISRSSFDGLVFDQLERVAASRLIWIALWRCIRSGDFPRQGRIQIDGRPVRGAVRRNSRDNHRSVAC
jgi:hypothetical protein